MTPTQNSVWCLSISGGPCSGKTTAMAHLLRSQTELFPGTRLLVVPEAATLYHSFGARLPFVTGPSTCGEISADERILLWEMLLNELKRSCVTASLQNTLPGALRRREMRRVLWRVRRLESRCINEALGTSMPSVVLCDRGAPQPPSEHVAQAAVCPQPAVALGC